MSRVNIYLAVLLITAFSCKQKQPDFHNMAWKDSGNADGIYFCISDSTKGETGKLSIQYKGWLNSSRFVTDTLDDLVKNADTIFTKAITDVPNLKQLPLGSKGYIKLDLDDFFLHGLLNTTHYMLFYPVNTDSNHLKKDSLTLASMNLFKSVEIITRDEAAEKFSKNYPDMEWKKYLDSNPLPSSIELSLKKELLLAGKMDSVKNVLNKLFPAVDLSVILNNADILLNPAKKKSVIYSFTVL